jgi:hypothetical protein
MISRKASLKGSHETACNPIRRHAQGRRRQKCLVILNGVAHLSFTHQQWAKGEITEQGSSDMSASTNNPLPLTTQTRPIICPGIQPDGRAAEEIRQAYKPISQLIGKLASKGEFPPSVTRGNLRGRSISSKRSAGRKSPSGTWISLRPSDDFSDTCELRKQSNLKLAIQWLRMAATLIHWKSRTLRRQSRVHPSHPAAPVPFQIMLQPTHFVGANLCDDRSAVPMVKNPRSCSSKKIITALISHLK